MPSHTREYKVRLRNISNKITYLIDFEESFQNMAIQTFGYFGETVQLQFLNSQ